MLVGIYVHLCDMRIALWMYPDARLRSRKHTAENRGGGTINNTAYNTKTIRLHDWLPTKWILRQEQGNAKNRDTHLKKACKNGTKSKAR